LAPLYETAAAGRIH